MDQPPPVLRTGLVGDGPAVKIDKQSPMAKRLLGLVFVLVKRAATSAALYCMHNGRHIVTPDDVRGALKYHAVTFFSEEGFEQLERDVDSMETFVEQFVTEAIGSDGIVDAITDEAIQNQCGGSEDDDDVTDDDNDTDDTDDEDDEDDDDSDADEDESESDEEEEDGDDPVTVSDASCDCDVCRGIRELDWNAWQPTDPAERFIKTHIDEIELEHAG